MKERQIPKISGKCLVEPVYQAVREEVLPAEMRRDSLVDSCTRPKRPGKDSGVDSKADFVLTPGGGSVPPEKRRDNQK